MRLPSVGTYLVLDMLVPILAGDLQIAYLTYHPDV